MTGLLLEVADRPSAGSILVGGAVLLIDKEGQKSPSLNDDMYDDDEDCPWQLSPKSALRIIRHTQGKTSAPPSSGRFLHIPFSPPLFPSSPSSLLVDLHRLKKILLTSFVFSSFSPFRSPPYHHLVHLV